MGDKGKRNHLTAGAEHFSESIGKRKPHLDEEDLDAVSGALLHKLGDSVSQGDEIAILKHLPDGRAELTVFSIDELEGE